MSKIRAIMDLLEIAFRCFSLLEHARLEIDGRTYNYNSSLRTMHGENALAFGSIPTPIHESIMNRFASRSSSVAVLVCLCAPVSDVHAFAPPSSHASSHQTLPLPSNHQSSIRTSLFTAIDDELNEIERSIQAPAVNGRQIEIDDVTVPRNRINTEVPIHKSVSGDAGPLWKEELCDDGSDLCTVIPHRGCFRKRVLVLCTGGTLTSKYVSTSILLLLYCYGMNLNERYVFCIENTPIPHHMFAFCK